jgi:hypothetical protein
MVSQRLGSQVSAIKGNTETRSISCLNGFGSSGNVKSQMGRAGPTHVEAKLAVKAKRQRAARHKSFLHRGQFRGSAGSAEDTG